MTVIPLGGRPSRQSAGGGGRLRRSRLLYEEVIDLVGRLISEGDLRPGDRLPSQRELAELAQVSLITVRRALEELEHAGRVRRHQGLGTFLAGPKILSDPSRTGQLGATLGDPEGLEPVGTQLLGITRCLPSADVATALGIEPHHHVWEVRRVRTIGGTPSIAERALIPVQLAPDLDTIYRGGSLYETLQSVYGLDDDFEEQVLDVINAEPEVRSLLELGPRTHVVRIQGLTRDKLGTPFDCFEQVYSAARFAFAIAGQTERRIQGADLARDWSATPVAGSPSPGSPAPRPAR